MERFIKAELLKLSKSLGYRILLTFSLAVGVVIGISAVRDMAAGMNGYEVFAESLVNYNVIIPFHYILFCIYSAVFVCAEYSNRSFALSHLNGMTRKQIFGSKALAYIWGLLPLVFLKAAAAVLITAPFNGFGAEPSAVLLPDMFLVSLCAVVCSSVLGCLYLTLAMLIRNNTGTVGTELTVSLCLPLISSLANDIPVLRFSFPYQMQQISSALKPESWGMFYSVMCVSMLALLSASAVIFSKTEFK